MRPVRILLLSSAALAIATLTLTGCGQTGNKDSKSVGDVTISLIEGQDGHEYMLARCTYGTSITHAQGCKTCAKK